VFFIIFKLLNIYFKITTPLFLLVHPYNAQNKNSGILPKYDTAEVRKKQNPLVLEAESKLKKDQISLPELLKNFDYKPTLNTKRGWYHHKVKKDTNQSWIEAPVSADGHIYLKARYVGTEPYNMMGLSVKCGQGETNSSPLAITSNYANRKKAGDTITEVLHLFVYKRKNGYDTRNLCCFYCDCLITSMQVAVIIFHQHAERWLLTMSTDISQFHHIIEFV